MHAFGKSLDDITIDAEVEQWIHRNDYESKNMKRKENELLFCFFSVKDSQLY